MPPVTTIARDPTGDRQRLEDQLHQALTRADYKTAAEVKQELGKLQAASTTVNDHARELQRLEEQLNTWTHADIQPP